jgi:hypothetical protein
MPGVYSQGEIPVSLLTNLLLLGATVSPGAGPAPVDGRADKPAPWRPDPRMVALLVQLKTPPPGPFHRTRIVQTILRPDRVLFDMTVAPYLCRLQMEAALRELLEQSGGVPKVVRPE